MSDSRSTRGARWAPGTSTDDDGSERVRTASDSNRPTAVDLTRTTLDTALDTALDSTLAEHPRDASETVHALPTLTIIVPMYREAARIAQTIETLASSTLHRPDIAFLFVDDGSKDETTAVARRAIADTNLANAHVESLAANVGKGGAVKAGMSIAKGRYLGFVDADLSLDPADVSRALARIESTGAHIVVGERVVNPLHQPKLRRLSSTLFRKLVWGMSGLEIADPQCALKIFRADVAAVLFSALTTDGFAFDVEVLSRAVQRGYRIDEMKIRWEHQPGSKVNPVSDGIGMYRELVRIRRTLSS